MARAALLVPLQRLDRSLFLVVHRSLAYRPVLALLSAVSRLGNGAFWVATIVLTWALARQDASFAALHMVATAAVGALLYQLLKERISRPRPCEAIADLVPGVPPLDRWSFPSGHTLHAVSFATLVAAWCPELLVVVIPFALLTAISRVALGLHYPFDVVAGGSIGLAVAEAMLAFRGPS